MTKIACPCCGCLTLEVRGRYDICPVCFWEDDGSNSDNELSAPNHCTLGEARANYREFGACDREMLPNVRKPKSSERAAGPEEGK